MKYWLMKSEPNAFSLEDLKNAKNGTECWDGIRNYQARNFMRDEMKIGDRVLFYHSVINPSVVGTAKVSRKSILITQHGIQKATILIRKALLKTLGG